MKKSYNDELKRLFRLNRELSTFVNRKRAMYFVKLIPTELALIAFSIYLYAQAPQIPVLLFCIFICLIPPFAFNPLKVFGNKKYGVIKSIEILDKITTSKNTINLRIIHGTTAEITIEEPKGKKDVLELDGTYARCYWEGDEIICIDTLALPINLNPHDMVACPYCGNLMPAQNKRCIDIGCKKLNIYKYKN